MGRAIAWFIGFILFIVLLVVLLTHGHKTPPPTTHVMTLPEYADTTATVSFTTDGIVNGDELHRQIRITIAQDRRVVDIIQGYSGQVIDSHSFYNTRDAYSAFLKSINFAGFMAKHKNSRVPADPTGQCALGFRYSFVLDNEGQDVSNLWTTSCGTNTGNWGGALETTQTLFRDQIPNYSTLTENVNLEATTTQ